MMYPRHTVARFREVDMRPRIITFLFMFAVASAVLTVSASAEAIPDGIGLFEDMRDRDLCPDGCHFVPAGVGNRVFAARLLPMDAIVAFDCVSIGRDGNNIGRAYCGIDIGPDRSLMLGLGAIAEVRGLPLHHAFAARLSLWWFTLTAIVHFGDSDVYFQTFLMFDLAHLTTR